LRRVGFAARRRPPCSATWVPVAVLRHRVTFEYAARLTFFERGSDGRPLLLLGSDRFDSGTHDVLNAGETACRNLGLGKSSNVFGEISRCDVPSHAVAYQRPRGRASSLTEGLMGTSPSSG